MQTRAYMTGERGDGGHCFHIRLVMISTNRLRRDLRACYGLAKEGFRTRPLTFVAQEHINDLPVFIYGTI